jgi:hypothetical protein
VTFAPMPWTCGTMCPVRFYYAFVAELTALNFRSTHCGTNSE